MRSTKVTTSVSASAIMLTLVLALGCASSPVGKSLNVGVGVSAGLDFTSTRMAIQSGRGHEGNVLLGQGAFRQAIVKVIGPVAVIGMASVVEKGSHRVLAHVIRSAAIVGWGFISVKNFQIARAR